MITTILIILGILVLWQWRCTALLVIAFSLIYFL